MKKIINFLLNKNLLLIITSILALFFTLAFFSNPLDRHWYDILWFGYSILVIFAVAHYIPVLASFLMDIHQSNLKDIKKQELEEQQAEAIK